MASLPADEWRGNGRVGSAIGVVAIHVLLGYAFIAGLRVTLPGRPANDPAQLVVLDLKPPPPPEPPRKPLEPASQGGAAPPPKARPLPQAAAPIPVLPAPRPIVVPPAMPGGNPAGGGTGGVGTGQGAAGAGSGQGESEGVGDGRGFSGARQIRGRFRNSDFPASAKGAGRLKIGVRYAVGPSGSVGQCEIIEPSGYPEVDAMTCRVIVARYRFKPARDEQGVPITEVLEEDYTWTSD